jgi:hypothetical protein
MGVRCHGFLNYDYIQDLIDMFWMERTVASAYILRLYSLTG